MEENKVNIFKGRITKVHKYAMQDNTLVQGIKLKDQGYFESSGRYAGSNGTYLEFGEYHGMALDVHFSLYDTDKKFVEINGEKYRIQQRIKLDIYNQVMSIWQLQRMSPQRYASIQSFEGKKVSLAFTIMEDSLESLGYDEYAVNIICAMPFMLGDKPILAATNIVVCKV